jgi:hypothetical protein
LGGLGGLGGAGVAVFVDLSAQQLGAFLGLGGFRSSFVRPHKAFVGLGESFFINRFTLYQFILKIIDDL